MLFAKKLGHRKTFAHRLLYTQMRLHRKAFTQKNLYTKTFTCRSLRTQKLSSHRRLYTQTLCSIDARRSICTQKLLHRKTLAQKGTQKLLHTGSFTHKSFYTEEPLHRATCTQQLLHRALLIQLQTLLSTESTFLHKSRGFYAQKLLHTEAGTRRSLNKHKLVHREALTRLPVHRAALDTDTFTGAFTHTHIHTQKPSHTHTDACTNRFFTNRYAQKALFTKKQRNFYTQNMHKPLHRAAFTHCSFYTQKPWHTAAFSQRSAYTEQFLHIDGTLLDTEGLAQGNFYIRKLIHTETWDAPLKEKLPAPSDEMALPHT